ncbi:unnamed protein product [Menidia menidia]|uniref:(Atlantic silverside) hypothetical protein n=1 Tax=Menidia menidia TaxID=238744 RepID=A0A8S4BJW1_9TELE|nr:unnamed protein product [Menidia menidia]
MPRVVPDQRSKFENEEFFRKLSRECEIKYTGFRDRPHEERQARFQNACRDGRSEVVSTSPRFVAFGRRGNCWCHVTQRDARAIKGDARPGEGSRDRGGSCSRPGAALHQVPGALLRVPGPGSGGPYQTRERSRLSPGSLLPSPHCLGGPNMWPAPAPRPLNEGCNLGA